MVIAYIVNLSFPAEYKAIQTTITELRANNPENIKGVGINSKIIDINKELAVFKYWDESIWLERVVLDEAAKLNYLK